MTKGEERKSKPEPGDIRTEPFGEKKRAPAPDGLEPRGGVGSEAGDPAHREETSVKVTSEAFSDLLGRLAGRSSSKRYEIEGELARGGQGAILRIWDEDLSRHLAMKVLLTQEERGAPRGTSAVDSQTLARFLEEAQVTAQLDHPGIVPVHEVGIQEDGGVFFTMKLVKGRDLQTILELAWKEEEGWTRTSALSVLVKVCEAMAYAHAKGVIHRDLKPANIMVGKFGEVYVMDWGLARVLGREDKKDVRIASPTTTVGMRSPRREASASASPLLTMDGDVLGTPVYMAPEQACGELGAMGPHSDVYSAGALLYQLVSGRMPYVSPGTRPAPHAILHLVQAGPPQPLHQLAVDAPAELVAICEKAMARDPRERYHDMSELASDLSAFIERRVVRAYETGPIAELRKWVHRNRALAASLATAVLVLIAGLVTSLSFARMEAAERGRAERNAYATLMDSTGLALEILDSGQAQQFLDAAPPGLRGWEWDHLHSRLDRSVLTREFDSRFVQGTITMPIVFDEPNESASFIYHVKDVGPVAVVWDTRDWARKAGSSFPISGAYGAQAYANGSRFAVLDASQAVQTQSAATGERTKAVVLDESRLGSVTVLPNPRGEDSLLARYEDLLLVRYTRNAAWMFLSPDSLGDIPGVGPAIVVSPDGVTFQVHRLDTGELLHSLPVLRANCCRFSPDGSRLAVGNLEGELSLWDLEDGSTVWPPAADEPGELIAIDFSTDGRWIAAGGVAGSVRQRKAETGEVARVLDAGGGTVLCIRFTPDGRSLVVASTDASVRIWDADPTDPLVLEGHTSFVYPVVLSPDGNRIASGSWDGTVRLWDVATGVEICTLTLPLADALSAATLNVYSLVYTPDGKEIIVSFGQSEYWEQTIAVFDAETGAHVADLPGGVLASVASDPRGNRIAVAHDGEVRVFNALSQHDVARFPSRGRVCAFSQAGPEWLATTTDDGMWNSLAIWDLGSSERVAVLEGHEDQIYSAAFSPDGRRLATASLDSTVRIWDPGTGRELAVLRGHSGAVFDVAFSPDGRRIASGGRDGLVHLWDAEELAAVGSLRGHRSYVYSLEWSSDGTRIVSGSGDHTLRIWETAPLAQRFQARRQRRDLVERLTPWVEGILAGTADGRQAIEAVRNASEFDAREREVGLQEVLRLSARSSQAGN